MTDKEIVEKTTVVKVTKEGDGPASATVKKDGQVGSATAKDGESAVDEASKDAQEK